MPMSHHLHLDTASSNSLPPTASSQGVVGAKRPRDQNEDQAKSTIQSCAECRRSKLKCDRTVPCQSCIKRNCAHLCPNGTLAATKGNVYLKVRVQELTEQAKSQAARIHELETELAGLKARIGHTAVSTPSPSNSDSSSSSDGYDPAEVNNVTHALGLLSMGEDGNSVYRSECASSEYLKDLMNPTDTNVKRFTAPLPHPLNLPSEIMLQSNAFPFGLHTRPQDDTNEDPVQTYQLLVEYCPPRERTEHLVDLYYEHGSWMFNPITRTDLEENIIAPLYAQPPVKIHEHRLSVFYIILAIGMHYDDKDDLSSDPEMEKRAYQALARASLSARPLVTQANCATVQSLFLHMLFMHFGLNMRGSDSSEWRWVLNGICARVAHTIGLHRDSSTWNLPPDETQRRRYMYWQFFTYETFGSFLNGRPPALFLRHSNCQFPDSPDIHQTRASPGLNHSELWTYWHHRFAATCLSAAIDHTFGPRSTNHKKDYNSLEAVDRKIRSFPYATDIHPPLLDMDKSVKGYHWSSNAQTALQEFACLYIKESSLLHIHRSYFTRAIREASEDPMSHRYALSVVAVFRSATRLILAMEGLQPIHPERVGMIWNFWSGIFSSCIVLGALVVQSPKCGMSQDAFQILEAGLELYRIGSVRSRPPETLNFLTKLTDRARASFGNKGFKPRPLECPSAHGLDPLDILEGYKSFIKRRQDSPVSSACEESPMQQECQAFEENAPTGEAAQAEAQNFNFSFQFTPPSAEQIRPQLSNERRGPAVSSYTLSPANFPSNDGRNSGVYRPLPPPTMDAMDSQDDFWRGFYRSFGGLPEGDSQSHF